MTPEGRLCVRTFKGKGIMNLHKHFQNESEFVTKDLYFTRMEWKEYSLKIFRMFSVPSLLLREKV